MKNADWDEGLTASDRARTKPIKRYALLWAITFLPAILTLPLGGTVGNQPVWAWALAVLPIPFAALLAYHYYRFIRASDEMMRRIHTEALAAGFGVAFVVGIALIMLGQLRVDGFSELTWFSMLITFVFKLHYAKKEYHAE